MFTPQVTASNQTSSFGNNLESFCKKFFYLSSGLKDEPSSQTIKTLLERVEKEGYSIDENQVVFGCEFGVYWPSLKSPSGHSFNVGIAIGKRGGLGIGPLTLQEYLESKVNEVEARTKNFEFEKTAKSIIQQTPTLPENSNPPSYSAAPIPSYSQTAARNRLLEMFGGLGAVAVVGGDWNSLEDFRRFGAFLGNHPHPANTYTADQFLGAELYIFDGGKCLIIKDKKNNSL
jgi:hypothetical protein